MMGYGYGTMMGGAGLFGAVIWLVVVADLLLLGMWLLKQINK